MAKKHSRKKDEPVGAPHVQHVKFDYLVRIADVLEEMAKEHVGLAKERDVFKGERDEWERLARDRWGQIRRLERSLRIYKGHLTRAKNKKAAQEVVS